MFVQSAKPNSNLNGIRYILRSILTILALQNVQFAGEKVFVREKINGIPSRQRTQERSNPIGLLFSFWRHRSFVRSGAVHERIDTLPVFCYTKTGKAVGICS